MAMGGGREPQAEGRARAKAVKQRMPGLLGTGRSRKKVDGLGRYLWSQPGQIQKEKGKIKQLQVSELSGLGLWKFSERAPVL